MDQSCWSLFGQRREHLSMADISSTGHTPQEHGSLWSQWVRRLLPYSSPDAKYVALKITAGQRTCLPAMCCGDSLTIAQLIELCLRVGLPRMGVPVVGDLPEQQARTGPSAGDLRPLPVLAG